MIEVLYYLIVIAFDRAGHAVLSVEDRYELEMARLERIERAEFAEDERRFREVPP